MPLSVHRYSFFILRRWRSVCNRYNAYWYFWTDKTMENIESSVASLDSPSSSCSVSSNDSNYSLCAVSPPPGCYWNVDNSCVSFSLPINRGNGGHPSRCRWRLLVPWSFKFSKNYVKICTVFGSYYRFANIFCFCFFFIASNFETSN